MDLDELEQLATRATPGPWERDKRTWDGDEIPLVVALSADRAEIVMAPTYFSAYPSGAFITVDGEVANAAFIAAFNPATALALLQRLRATEALVEAGFEEALREGANIGSEQMTPSDYPDSWSASTTKQQLDALREGK